MIADALLVIDMQNGVCRDGVSVYNIVKCVSKINTRIAEYRLKDKPIIFVQHNDETLLQGESSWEIIPEIDINENDVYIQKTHANSFYKTDLQKVLTDLAVVKIEVCGAQTEYCVDSTIKMAQGLGYELKMYSGSTTTYDNKYMTAEETISFYEGIWDKRFLELLA